MTLFAIHWGQWTLFGVLLTALVVFVFYMIVIDPKKQRERLAKEKRHCDAFVAEMKTDDCLFTAESHHWKQLTPHYRDEAAKAIWDYLTDPTLDGHRLNQAIVNLRASPLSKDLTDAFVRSTALACIERSTEMGGLHDLADTAWGEGNIPTDVVLKLIERADWSSLDFVLQGESRPENQDQFGTLMAQQGRWEYLEDIFGEGKVPERYFRMALEALLKEERNERIRYDVMHCYVLLNEWDNLLAFMKENELPMERLLYLLREAPAPERDKFGQRFAEEGWIWRLILLFNPEQKLEDLEMPPPVVPPEPMLRTCFERLKVDMVHDETDDGLFERMAAECAMLLNDLEQCQEIADHCVGKKYPGIAGPLLYFIQRSRRDQSVATTPAS